jgi:hypothetical protein
MKTNELTRAALDWAVAKCEGRQEPEVVNNFAVAWYTWPNTHYSTDWAQGGPIIEREKLTLDLTDVLFDHETDECVQLDKPEWWASKDDVTGRGPTPLIAAMRCYVASKLGDDIDIPEELI